MWENWTKDQLLTLFSIATPVLVGLGALLDRLLLALLERNKRISFDSKIETAQLYDNSDAQMRYGGQNVDLVEYLHFKFRLKFFNNRKENIPLHKFYLSLTTGKLFRRREIARYSIDQSDTLRKSHGLWKMDVLDETTLPSKKWFSVNCEIRRVENTEYDQSDTLWIVAEDDRGREKKWRLVTKSDVKVRDNR